MIKKYLFIISVIIIGSLLIAQDDFGDFGDEQNASEGVAEGSLITITGTISDANGNAIKKEKPKAKPKAKKKAGK